MKQLEHVDVVLFDTIEDLKEYIQLSGDPDIAHDELSGNFPRIQSKHWSFDISLTHLFELKQTALSRLISYNRYKELHS